ncbi:MAG: tetratricopeptide repeat protein [Candidatus Cryptobacteroides sp.]
MTKKTILSCAAAALLALTSAAQEHKGTPDFEHALAMYDAGMLSKAMNEFAAIPGPVAEGYRVLCSVELRTGGYEEAADAYMEANGWTGLSAKIRMRMALNYFDDGDFATAGHQFNIIPDALVDGADRAEFLYKRAYCDFHNGDTDGALYGFRKVDRMPFSDFTSPSRYGIGYILYEREQFAEALKWFEQSRIDARFEEQSNYYMVECRFMLKDYDYVTTEGAALYDRVPEERKSHFARIISESFLVKGDAVRAQDYYDMAKDAPEKTRSDYFYAGTLLFTVKDYAGAVENYSAMGHRRDSIGQVASYQMGYSYIQIRNKVAAMDAFREAAELDFDPAIREDAFFNWAKLSFDLNNDSSVFDRYIATYSDRVKGQQIYAYQALAALNNHDYAGAVAAYDNIDELDADMIGNYMKANYLRAEQLIGGGSWRNAVPCLKAAAFYADRRSGFNQLSRYWLAESYYNDGQYRQARQVFAELYNLSALDRREEGRLLPYNIAYCYFKEGNYDQAYKWFGTYVSSRNPSQKRDALIRRADCLFVQKKYRDAASAYGEAVSAFPGANDLYPYYQAGIASGLSGDAASKTKYLGAALDARPDAQFYNETLYELARTYADASDRKNASACYERLLSSSSDKTFKARALLGLGILARNEKDYDAALEYYKRVVKDLPQSEYSADALLAIESIYEARQEPENYLAYLETIGGASGKTEADKEELLFNSAEQIFLAGNYGKAVVSLQSYLDRYPAGQYGDQVVFYMAESYKGLGQKEKACDYYVKVLDGRDDSYKEVAALGYAQLSYQLEHYDDALDGYRTLASVARMEKNRHLSAVGMMESAYMGRRYQDVPAYADAVRNDASSTDSEKLMADYVKAKSLLAVSRRDEAFAILKTISGKVRTPQGAEAAVMLIQDSYDKGDFESVEKQVYAFSDSGTNQTYWLAKAFIILGDSFVDRGDLRQAKATFESVRDGYTPSGTADDVPDNVNMRLGKLSKMNQ